MARKGRCKVGDKKSHVPAKSPKRTWKGAHEAWGYRAYDGRQQAMEWARVGAATGHGKPVNDGHRAIVPDCQPPTSDAWKGFADAYTLQVSPAFFSTKRRK